MAVSVIISTAASHLDHLREMLDSLVVQVDAPPFEIIVVDNRGSQELSELVAERVSAGLDISVEVSDRRTTRWHPQVGQTMMDGIRNRAFGANVGAGRTKDAEYLIFLDDDDRASPNYVAAMYEALLEHPYVGARMDVTRLNEAPWVSRRRPMQDVGIPMHAGFPFVVGAATGIRRDLFVEVGGYDIDLDTQEDVDLGIRLFAVGVEPRLVRDATLHYRYRDTYRRTYDQERAYGAGEVDIYMKHHFGRRSPRRVLGDAYVMARSLANSWNPSGRAALCTRLGSQMGRIEGSLRHGVMYL